MFLSLRGQLINFIKKRRDKMTKWLCCRCKKNQAGEYQDLSFVYLGLSVTIPKDGMTCADCAKELWIEEFEENAKEFIIISKGGKPRVNWPHYGEFFAEGRFSTQKEKLYYILVQLGILSLQPEGNWDIMADGPIGLNPRAYLSYLYFTQKKDAIVFARLRFASTLYNWEIRQIGKVLKKDDVLKRAIRSK